MIALCFSAFSQELYRISSTAFNNVVYAPSLSAAYSGTNLTLLGRKQWNINGAPTTGLFIGHGQINGSKLYVSGGISNDQIGIWNRTFGSIGLTYKLKLDDNNFIGVGVAPGFSSDQIDLTRAEFNAGDNVINYQIDNKVYFNGTTSATYGNSKLNLTVSAGFQDFTRQKNVFGMVSKQFDFGSFDLLSNVLYKQSLTTSRNQTEINAIGMYNQFIGIGAGYRLNSEFVGHFRLNVKNKYMVGYCYDMGLSKLKGLNGHEVFLRLVIPSKNGAAALFRTGFTNPIL